MRPEPEIPPDLPALHADGVAQVRAGDFGAATATFERILAADPNHGEALNALGVLAFQNGDRVRARDLLVRALQLLPADSAP